MHDTFVRVVTRKCAPGSAWLAMALTVHRWLRILVPLALTIGSLALLVHLVDIGDVRAVAQRGAVRSERLLARVIATKTVRGWQSSLVLQVVEHFRLVLAAISSSRRASAILGFTGLVWLCGVLAAMLVARAFDVALTPMHAILLLSALGIAAAVPTTPGSLGIFQLVAVSELGPVGYSPSGALVAIVAFQVIAYAVVVAWRETACWKLGMQPIFGMRRADSAPLP